MDSDTAPSQRVPAEAPNGEQPQRERLSRSATLLILLQGLATLGKILLRTVQRNDTRPAERIEIYTRFSTRNVALIVARIRRGLMLIAGLEYRVMTVAKQMDAERPDRPSVVSKVPRKVSVRRKRPAFSREADDAALLRRLPTVEEIAAMVLYRPIGEVLEDICRDLGVVMGDEVWAMLEMAVLEHRGSTVRLLKQDSERMDARLMPTVEEAADYHARGLYAPLIGAGSFREPGRGPPTGLSTGPPLAGAA